MKYDFIITGGGTGGHFFPALKLYTILQDKGHKTILVTDQRCRSYAPDNINLKVFNLKVSYKNLYSKIFSIFAIIRVFVHFLVFFIKSSPSLVVSFGGYTSFPIAIAALVLGKKLIIYEQNIMPGKANLLLSHFAYKIVLSYARSKEYFQNKTHHKILVTGPIMRFGGKALQNQTVKKSKIDFQNKKFSLLVLGGSQGASIFANLIPKAVNIICQKKPDISIKITHQVRKSEIKDIVKIYENLKINHDVEYILKDFFIDMESLYRDNMLMICRSGASTISEIAAYGLPAIFVPFALSAGQHQLINAKYMKEKTGIPYFEEKTISADLLAEKILEFENKRELLVRLSSSIYDNIKDGTENLIEIIETI